VGGYTSIAAVGKSIERLIGAAFAERQPVPNRTTKVVLIRTEDLADDIAREVIGTYGLSILLYRVDFNKAMRASWSAVGHADGRGHLALDLHYLVTPWADNAEYQHMILGRALQTLEATPVLSGPLLYAPPLPAGYADEPQAAATDAVQLMLEDVSTEALMRTFDSLPSDYRLSVPYVARVVRIDTRIGLQHPPVTDADIRLRSAT
jgi:Pvc16 N-terminal domain